jgi:tol-pal system protein YbgF
MMFKSGAFAALLLTFVSMPVAAQDIATRILNIENRIKDLTVQMEELNNSLQQLQKQIGNTQQGALAEPVAKPKAKAVASAEQGIETIEDAPAAAAVEPKPKRKAAIVLGSEQIETEDLAPAAAAASVAPGPTNLASGEDNSAGAGGQVIVDGQQEVAQAVAPAQNAVVDTQAPADSVEQVSLTPADTPEALYEKHYETLLRRQFGEAEAGFRDFLQKHPDHSLAGSAQYQLGETFYAQGNFQEAARNFLLGYKNYPKSRRAPDSLVKLGMSLRKMDQRDQACASFQSVATEFPRAVEAKKRAQAEMKRAGC